MNGMVEKTGIISSSVQALLEKIKSPDANERIAAIKVAPEEGAAAVVPLGEIYGSNDLAAAKAAHEALRRIVHHSARPNAIGESKTVVAKLLLLIDQKQPLIVRKEALHLLSFIASEEQAERIGKQLSDADVREEARLSLQRIPGSKVDKVLREAAHNTAGEFRAALELSLRSRSQIAGQMGLKRL